jgi:hypothetical protein
MKKVCLLLTVLFIVMPLSARSTLEFCPKVSLYINDGAFYGIGADITVNPKKQFGLRVNLCEFVSGDAELAFGDFDGPTLNSSVGMSGPTEFDFLYYTDIAGLFSYIAFTFGFSALRDFSAFEIGGGPGLEKCIGKENYVFFEPGLFYRYADGAGDVLFKFPFGFKFGI